MAFAGHCGLDIDLGDVADPIAACFAEELGAVVQIPAARILEAREILDRHGLAAHCKVLGEPVSGTSLTVAANGAVAFSGSRDELHRRWSEVSFRMQALRDNPECAREEYSRLLDAHDPGLHASLSFDPAADIAAPYIARGARPAVAVLREQGVNSQTEMGAAFTRAGFDAYDVHMTDILTHRVRLSRFHGLVACGGFSFGDVLGAGEGWAKSILFNPWARDEFSAFFARDATFTLGVCNGCQMLSALHGVDSGDLRLAALRAQPLRAVRSAREFGTGAAINVGPALRHARLRAAHCGGARGGIGGVRGPPVRGQAARGRHGGPAVRR